MYIQVYPPGWNSSDGRPRDGIRRLGTKERIERADAEEEGKDGDEEEMEMTVVSLQGHDS